MLASSSLQYVDDFEGYLSALVGLGAQFFCIDRTPMGAGEEMEIFLQRVFRSDGEFQYETSYPMFVYPESEYMEILSREYTVNVKNVLHGDSVETDDGKVDLFFVVGSRRET